MTETVVKTGLAPKTFPFITAHWNISISLHSLQNIPASSCRKWLLSDHIESIQEGLSGDQEPLHFQPKQKFERPICVSWSTDLGSGRWTPSGCVVLEASEMYTVCSCNRLANLAIIMASGELTVSADTLCSDSPLLIGKNWFNIWVCPSWCVFCEWVMGTEGICGLLGKPGHSYIKWEMTLNRCRYNTNHRFHLMSTYYVLDLLF